MSDYVTPWTADNEAFLSITISQSLLKLMSVELVMPSNYLILFCLLLLPSIFPSIRVFSNESALCIRWPKYWSFSFIISPFNENSGLISLLSKGLKSLLQHHSLKASILGHSGFFMVQLSHPYMTTEIPRKTIVLTIAYRGSYWNKPPPQSHVWKVSFLNCATALLGSQPPRGRPFNRRSLHRGWGQCHGVWPLMLRKQGVSEGWIHIPGLVPT